MKFHFFFLMEQPLYTMSRQLQITIQYLAIYLQSTDSELIARTTILSPNDILDSLL